MISTDYTMTFGYGRIDPPYGTAEFPYHRGDDWYMPDGTPIVVNAVQIGVSGHTGFVTGPHCHIGRFVSGKDTNPNSQGWTLQNPKVTDIGYDDTNGNYVGLLDAQGIRWVYLHMQEKSTNVKVGDALDNLPKFNQEQDMNPSDVIVDRTIATRLWQGWLHRSPANDGETDNIIGMKLIDAMAWLDGQSERHDDDNMVHNYYKNMTALNNQITDLEKQLANKGSVSSAVTKQAVLDYVNKNLQ